MTLCPVRGTQCTEERGGDGLRLLSGVVKTAGARRAVQTATIVAFAAVAIVNWWLVIEQGPSTARLLAAIIATAVAVVTRFRKPIERSLGHTEDADDDQ